LLWRNFRSGAWLVSGAKAWNTLVSHLIEPLSLELLGVSIALRNVKMTSRVSLSRYPLDFEDFSCLS
jgi:hypothetical protein